LGQLHVAQLAGKRVEEAFEVGFRQGARTPGTEECLQTEHWEIQVCISIDPLSKQ
jgi:hypothetical protein